MALLHKIKILLEFGWFSNTFYRLHSPFLYKLAEDVFENSDYYYNFDIIDFHYSRLIQDTSIINHTEFSYLRNQAQRNLGEFALRALHQPSELFKLYKLLKYKPSSHILELGSCLGLSTLAIALSSPHSKIIAVEGNSQFATLAKNMLASNSHVEIKNQLFEDYLSNLRKEKFDFIMIDGDHTYEATMRTMGILKNHMTPSSMILLDDIHWSPGMYKAWKELINWNEFPCSLETIRWGLLFNDKSLTPGKFSLIPSNYKFWEKYL